MARLIHRLAPKNPFELPPQARRKENGLEKRFRLALEASGEPFIQQYQVGRYAADFYLPQREITIDIDGERWHPNEEVAKLSLWARKRFENGKRRDTYFRTRGLIPVHLMGNAVRKEAGELLAEIIRNFPRK